MAKKAHLDIILQGVEAWNEWREQNVTIMPDLSDAEFWNANLSRADLTRTNLSGAEFYSADLSAADLTGAKLFVIRANLSGANLSGTTKLTQTQIEQAVGDAQTKLPDHLKRPAAWSRSSDEEPSRGA